MTAAITPETAAQFPFMRYGFRLYDEVQLRDLHDAAGFQRVDLGIYGGTTTNLAGARIEYTYYFVRSLA